MSKRNNSEDDLHVAKRTKAPPREKKEDSLLQATFAGFEEEDDDLEECNV
jgi:hypothetical protein